MTLRDPRTGEAMHSLIGPLEEADLLYIGQSRLADRLSASDPTELVVFDLGLGIAANAVAALRCAESVPEGRRLRVVSFENDIDGLRQAIAAPEVFPFLADHAAAVRTLLAQGHAESARWCWELRVGEYPATLGGVAPEVIFHDFYSPKSTPLLWTEDCLRRLRAECARATLYSYSSATAFRASLLAAGFYVGEGRSTSAKRDTTVAATHREDLEKPLSPEWKVKLERSGAISEELRARAMASLQFREN